VSEGREGVLGAKLSEQARSVADAMALHSLEGIQRWSREEVEYFQWLVFINQVAHERQAAMEHGGFLSDRSVVDNYAYVSYYNCNDSMQRAIAKFCTQHVASYDILFYMPVPMQLDVTHLPDGFRMTSLKSIIEVDEIMQKLFKDAAEFTNVVPLSHDRARWVDEVCDEVDNFCLTSA
jgi:predicted ATPase